MKLVSVNILNYEQKDYLADCIDSLLKQIYTNIELMVIDNGSGDGSVQFLKEKYPQIKVMALGFNAGFAKAHNIGIKSSRGESILLLNVDIILAENFIDELVKAMESDSRVGMVQGKLYRMISPHDLKTQRTIDTSGIVIHKNRCNLDRGYGQIDNGQFDKREYIFGASGAAPLYRRQMLEDVKIGDEYFDELFFMYREEADLAWRSQLLNWKCIYAPDAIAYHIRRYSRQTRRFMPRHLKRLQHRNRYLMIIKNDILPVLLLHLPFILWFELCFFFYMLFREPYLFADLKGVFELLPKVFLKRSHIMKRRRVYALYMLNLFK